MNTEKNPRDIDVGDMVQIVVPSKPPFAAKVLKIINRYRFGVEPLVVYEPEDSARDPFTESLSDGEYMCSISYVEKVLKSSEPASARMVIPATLYDLKFRDDDEIKTSR